MICERCKLDFKDSDIVRCVRYEHDPKQIKPLPLNGEVEIDYETGRIKRPPLLRIDIFTCRPCGTILKEEACDSQ